MIDDRNARGVILDPGTDAPREPAARLVVGFDRDEAGRAALGMAVHLAGRLHARLTVVHVVSLGDYPLDPDVAGWEEQAQQALEGERREVERALAEHPFGWSYQASYGTPAATLLQVADDQDALMVIVGRHGSGLSEGLRRLVDGSVSRSLARRCRRPVLVVPHS